MTTPEILHHTHPILTLQELALDAHKRAQEEHEKRERESAKRAWQAGIDDLRRFLQYQLSVDFEPDAPCDEVDGLRFDVHTDRDSLDGYTSKELRLLRTCDLCGRDAATVIHSLPDLGRVLQNGELPYHSCGEWSGDRNYRPRPPPAVPELSPQLRELAMKLGAVIEAALEEMR